MPIDIIQTDDCPFQESWTTSTTMLKGLTLVLIPKHVGAESNIFDRKFFLKITIVSNKTCERNNGIVTRWSQLQKSNQTGLKKDLTLGVRKLMPVGEKVINSIWPVIVALVIIILW